MLTAIRVSTAALLVMTPLLAQTGQPVLARTPAVNKTHVVFHFAGDLWTVPREGGEAARLTTGIGSESNPVISPDGNTVAFEGEYDGNNDVFVVPVRGGVPKRLTYHPGADSPVAWTPDGKSVLFRSPRNRSVPGISLYTIALDGTLPTEVPLPHAAAGSFSPDAKRLAYVPLFTQGSWRRYRGGQTTPIYIADLADSRIEKLPRTNSNDFAPMWIKDKLYFLTDRYDTVTLAVYDPKSKKVVEVIKNPLSDIRSASASPDGDTIAYELLGSLHLLDVASGKSKQVPIRIAADLPELRPRFVSVTNRITNARLSPTGARVVFSARGEVLTVPAEKGDIRNVTNTPGVHERWASWSPDGKRIAYFSDESGEYELHVRDQSGTGEVKKINLGNPPSFFLQPVWSPDSKKISYMDKRLTSWYVDLDKGEPVRIDKDVFQERVQRQTPVWSSDSKWLAYAKVLRNHFRAIHIYSLESGKTVQVTDGMSDAASPAWDASGKYLYFTASTDIGPSLGDDVSTFNRAVSRSAYLVVLRKDLPSPLAPESDEEKSTDKPGDKPSDAPKPETSKPDGDKAEGPKPDAPKPDAPKPDAAKPPSKPPEPVKVDFENIDQRILALPVPTRNYANLRAGKENVVFLLEYSSPTQQFGPQILHKFDLKTRKTDKVIEGIGAFDLSHNGEKMLFTQGEGPNPRWIVAGTGAPPKPGEGALKLEAMEVKIDPMAEWRQIYREIWRGERDFFYDPGHHGLDLKSAQERHQKYLETIGSRADLTYLVRAMLSEMEVSHLFAAGEASGVPEVKRVRGGLLGADYKIENGRYRFARVYRGENWTPQLKAPLTQPGVNVATGEYLLAVNGRELQSSDNLYAAFENTAGKSVTIRVGPNPNLDGSREVTVVPVENENQLRNLAWIDDNRRKVDQMTQGRVAYVYLPNTHTGGVAAFNRYFFAQIGKEAVIVDERYNGGGLLGDFFVEHLNRRLLSMGVTRDGETFTTPQGAIFGPKVMLVNEYAGSGGDALPYYFKKTKTGPLVGTRTWGGLVRGGGPPVLMDGGFVSAPDAAIFDENGEWVAENKGVAPDFEVEQDPAEMRKGRDPQLEKGIEVVMDLLKKSPPPERKRPPYTDHYPKPPASTTSGR